MQLPQVLQPPPEAVQVLLRKVRGYDILCHRIGEYTVLKCTGTLAGIADTEHCSILSPDSTTVVLQGIAVQILKEALHGPEFTIACRFQAARVPLDREKVP